MNILFSILVLVSGLIGGFTANKLAPSEVELFTDVRNFGAITYPTSLDAFSNPGATDQVSAVVTHSTQHANANDAIEALQAKLGISASTAVTNSILAGNGSGSSIWTTYATTTNLSTTDLQTSTILATGSTTLQNFTFVNATGTSATTTNLFATTASTTNFYGAGLSTCTGSNFAQWSGGKFSCAATTVAGVEVFATTSVQNLATTTISSADLPNTDTLSFMLSVPNVVGSGATTTAQLYMSFNDDFVNTNYITSRILVTTHNNVTDRNGVLLAGAGGDGRFQRYAKFDLSNISGMPKTGSADVYIYGTTTPIVITSGNYDGVFVWVNANKVTDIKFWWDQPNVFFGTSTAVRIMGY